MSILISLTKFFLLLVLPALQFSHAILGIEYSNRHCLVQYFLLDSTCIFVSGYAWVLLHEQVFTAGLMIVLGLFAILDTCDTMVWETRAVLSAGRYCAVPM